MRIVTLGLSTCLAACVGTVPVASTDQGANTDPAPLLPASDPLEKDNAPGKDDTAPSQTKVASSYNVEPVANQIHTDQEPASIDMASRLIMQNIGTVDPASKTTREHSSTEVSYGQEDDESVFVRTTYKGGEFFTVGTSFTRKKRVDDFDSPTEEDRGFWHMKMSSAAGGPGPALEAEFAQSSFDPETSEGFGVPENRLIRLSGSNSWQGFSLGLGYQSVGTSFAFGGKTATGRIKNDNNPQKKLRKGRQGTEAWVSRQFGNLGVKTLASVYQDKSEGDDNAPHFTTYNVGSSLNYMISSWPSVGIMLDYGSGVKGSSNEPNGFQSTQVSVENIATSFYYSDDAWDGTLYVENVTGEGTTNIANIRTYWLGGSYFPISTFSLTPSVSYVKEEYPEFDVNTDSYAASMTASYKPSAISRFVFTGYSEYSTQKNRDWEMDSEYMYSSLGVNWDSSKPKSFIKKWSLELFRDQYIDNLYSDNSIGGVGFMLKLRSATNPRAISRSPRENIYSFSNIP